MNQKTPFLKSVKKQTLAEQVADTIKESILNGEFEPGAALPTEPELAEAFGVSRAVVRDATRMLAARGLVEAQHGRGVFVTHSPIAAFGDALLLALRRVDATVWDVEQFEQLLLPEVCALAAVQASDEEIVALRELVARNLQVIDEILAAWWSADAMPEAEQQRMWASGREVIQALFQMSHNRVLQLLVQPLLALRNLRYWEEPATTLEAARQREADFFQTLVTAVASRDPEQARSQMRTRMALPPEAETAMRQTPVGEIPHIAVAS
ncbi:MAG TPA: GntR family transcriptional regulator [Chloroflexota bacterium]|nr:GntR family transcriptional regulator [Chloroflexota bacterium]